MVLGIKLRKSCEDLGWRREGDRSEEVGIWETLERERDVEEREGKRDACVYNDGCMTMLIMHRCHLRGWMMMIKIMTVGFWIWE